METGRGFVLHTNDFIQDSTLVVSETIALTATVDILKAMAEGTGPRQHILALGYAAGRRASWNKRSSPMDG